MLPADFNPPEPATGRRDTGALFRFPSSSLRQRARKIARDREGGRSRGLLLSPTSLLEVTVTIASTCDLAVWRSLTKCEGRCSLALPSLSHFLWCVARFRRYNRQRLETRPTPAGAERAALHGGGGGSQRPERISPQVARAHREPPGLEAGPRLVHDAQGRRNVPPR